MEKKQLKNLIPKLMKWFEINQRSLPWRVTGLKGKKANPYHVWIAEIMSQQTQMVTLIPYYHRFLSTFPTLERLANATEAEVLQAWTGLGYYSRARNVQKLAQIIVSDYKSQFPQTYAEWLALPGVGPYTAAAVVSQCFGEKVPVWDGNVLRVTSRLFCRDDAYLSDFKLEMLELLQQGMEFEKSASTFNQAWMELGALVCTPKNPSCGRCPLQISCGAFLNAKTNFYPPPKPRKKALEILAKVWVLEHQNKLFLTERKRGDWFSGMWDFPSELGGVKTPKKTMQAIKTVLQKKQSSIFGKTKHSITHHKIILEGHKLHIQNRKDFLALDKEQGQWIDLEKLIQGPTPVPLSTTARKILKIFFNFKNEEF